MMQSQQEFLSYSTYGSISLSFMADDLNPDLVTELLRLRPTKSYRKGDMRSYDPQYVRVARGSECYIRSLWEYEIKENPLYDVGESVEKLISKFDSRLIEAKNVLSEKYNDLETCISVVLYIKDGRTPGIFFDRKFLDFVHSIDAVIDIDTYIDSAG